LVIARANAQRDGERLPIAASDSQESDLRERLRRPNAWNYVAINQDQIVGFALGYPRTNEQTPAAAADEEYLSLLMVEPNCWRQGIASGLLAKIIHQARDAGRNRLTLYTRKEDNDNAQTFYRHQGFIPTGRTKENSEYGPQDEYEFTL